MTDRPSTIKEVFDGIDLLRGFPSFVEAVTHFRSRVSKIVDGTQIPTREEYDELNRLISEYAETAPDDVRDKRAAELAAFITNLRINAFKPTEGTPEETMHEMDAQSLLRKAIQHREWDNEDPNDMVGLDRSMDWATALHKRVEPFRIGSQEDVLAIFRMIADYIRACRSMRPGRVPRHDGPKGAHLRLVSDNGEQSESDAPSVGDSQIIPKPKKPE